MTTAGIIEPNSGVIDPEVGSSQSSLALTLRRAVRMTRVRIGLAILALILFTAIFGPLFAQHSPTEFVGPPFVRSAPGAPLGTDVLGRDVITRFLYGGRTILIIALLATLIGVGLGAAVGIVAAYTRGVIDDILMRASDVVLAFPQIVLILLLISAGGSHAWLLVLAVALGHIPQTARVIRGAALEVTERDFVKLARAVGQRRWRILAVEILPNVSSPLMVEFGLRMTYSIALVAAASFLGLGATPPAANWGLMINENRIGLVRSPWSVLLPVAGIALLTVGLNLVTDGVALASIRADRTEAQ